MNTNESWERRKCEPCVFTLPGVLPLRLQQGLLPRRHKLVWGQLRATLYYSSQAPDPCQSPSPSVFYSACKVTIIIASSSWDTHRLRCRMLQAVSITLQVSQVTTGHRVVPFDCCERWSKRPPCQIFQAPFQQYWLLLSTAAVLLGSISPNAVTCPAFFAVYAQFGSKTSVSPLKTHPRVPASHLSREVHYHPEYLIFIHKSDSSTPTLL